MTPVGKGSFHVRHHARGVTFVELIAFIVIVSVVAAAMVQAFSLTMRGSHYGKELTQATQIAQQRMEVIFGQRKRLDYNGFDANTFDPCDNVPPASAWAAQACQTTVIPAGSYVVTSQLGTAVDVCGAGTGTLCKLITVTVTGPYGDVLTILTAQVWNY